MDEPSREPSSPRDRLKGLTGALPVVPDDWRLAAGSVVLGLAVAAGAVFAAGPWDSGQRTAEREWAADRAPVGDAAHRTPAAGPPAPEPAPSAAAVLTALRAGAAPAAAAGLARSLDPLLKAPALGTRTTAVVVDTATGKQLYGRSAGTPMTPASTVKIATAVAALSARGPDHRIATTVRGAGDLRTVTLVGGGDPTLDEQALRGLAAATAASLREAGADRRGPVTVAYDVTRYSGPGHHPIGPNDNIAPMTALMVDEARLDDSDKGPAPRSSDPAGDAARRFAGLLTDAGVKTTADPRRQKAAAGARTLATHRSAPLSALVERMLTNSDNDIAEALARQTALAAGRPGSFDGAAKAVAAQLGKAGLPIAGARFADGSGLDRGDRVSAGLLAALLARAADPAHPELRSVLTGLPVAGFSGTLGGRYAATSDAAGLVRAKTGTLTGVNALAGTVVSEDGRLLSFAFLTSGTTAPGAAEAALDDLAGALVPRTR